MEGVIEFIHLQYLLPSQYDQGFFKRKAKYFIRGQELAFTNGAGLPVLRSIIGDAPGSQRLRFAGDTDGDIPCAVGYEGGCQLIGTPKEKLGIMR